MEKVKVVILAAGQGKRMQSDKPKTLAQVAGKPMLEHLGIAALEATGAKPLVVVGIGGEMIRSALGDNFIYVTQEEQLGTGHALLTARDACAGAERVVVLYGDHPFVTSATIKKLIEKSVGTGAKITLASTIVPNFENENKVFSSFARILREAGEVKGIREKKDASGDEHEVMEVNPGYYVFQTDWLWPNLEKIETNNAQGEYYLTDLLKMSAQEGEKIESIQIEPREAMGANSKEELEILEKLA